MRVCTTVDPITQRVFASVEDLSLAIYRQKANGICAEDIVKGMLEDFERWNKEQEEKK